MFILFYFTFITIITIIFFIIITIVNYNKRMNLFGNDQPNICDLSDKWFEKIIIIIINHNTNFNTKWNTHKNWQS